MGDNDWYRQERWGERQRNSFFDRLARSRSDSHKAQYCRIQALYLQETGKTAALRGAVDLLNRILEHYPDESTQLASVYLQKAQCCDDVGRAEEAIENFRYCIDYQRQFPHTLTNAALEFGVFVLRHEFSDLHEEVLSVLDEFPCGSAFPQQVYDEQVIRALVAEDQGDDAAAHSHAQRAIAACGRDESGYRYHPKIGLVERKDKKLHKRVSRIAGS